MKSEFSVLGIGNGVQILQCVMDYFHSICPSHDGTYVGHLSAGDNEDGGEKVPGGAHNNTDGHGQGRNPVTSRLLM